MTLQSVRIRNFKAIVDSRMVRFGPLTVFIGHNGSGKSSLIEALETYQSIIVDGLDIAMQRWLGIEHVRHFGAEAKERAGKALNAIAFDVSIGASVRKSTRLEMTVNNDAKANRMFISSEKSAHANGWIIEKTLERVEGAFQPGGSILASATGGHRKVASQVRGWQFLTLQPERMGLPIPQQRTSQRVRLAKDGSNVADYLLDIQRLDTEAFEGIVRTMAYVLPYARDLQPALTSELERKAYLQLTESNYKVPGWMLSTGTLRVLALLAVLRHPEPPPLIVVEEIENGLDPRSIHLLVEEIRNVVLAGVTQVVLTTHSPYLLDLLKLDQLILVTRDGKGEPRFHRPVDDAKLAAWAKEFAPGRLYTMGSLHEAAQ
ncbi:MAG: AAA family ATPase [Burkholderiales bacterium]|nr:AAA family ATPase [Burkholderiales bacterium]